MSLLRTTGLAVVCALAVRTVEAQRQPSTPAPTVSTTDAAAIRATALDYIEGWYAGDVERMERAVHPELAKRIVHTNPENGRSAMESIGAMTLVQRTRRGGGRDTPANEQQKDVVILDVFRSTASVRVTAGEWVDYLHLAKFNGRWVIINVLWEMKAERDR